MPEFYTIASPVSEILTKEKGSRFLGYAFPVSSAEMAERAIESIRQLYPKATHHCFAYRLGSDNQNYRANDDGEPRGTAGLPIYNQLLAHEVTDCLVIVVRYYGGVKLGVSGLIKAYKENAAEVLQYAEKVAVIPKIIYEVSSQTADQHLVFGLLHRFKAEYDLQTTSAEAIFTVSIPEKDEKEFSAALAENYKVSFKKVDN